MLTATNITEAITLKIKKIEDLEDDYNRNGRRIYDDAPRMIEGLWAEVENLQELREEMEAAK